MSGLNKRGRRDRRAFARTTSVRHTYLSVAEEHLVPSTKIDAPRQASVLGIKFRADAVPQRSGFPLADLFAHEDARAILR
jgi:hypothetical protein